jgi:hypothetical protein
MSVRVGFVPSIGWDGWDMSGAFATRLR